MNWERISSDIFAFKCRIKSMLPAEMGKPPGTVCSCTAIWGNLQYFPWTVIDHHVSRVLRRWSKPFLHFYHWGWHFPLQHVSRNGELKNRYDRLPLSWTQLIEDILWPCKLLRLDAYSWPSRECLLMPGTEGNRKWKHQTTSQHEGEFLSFVAQLANSF